MGMDNIIVANKMRIRVVKDFPPVVGNPRNSEGSFLRAPDGTIHYAYSRFTGTRNGDDCPSDIALIRSCDEGETWSEPEIIARAKDFGVHNIMSVSGVYGLDGSLHYYFLVKEDGGMDLSETGEELVSSIGRTVSYDGGRNFQVMRCKVKAPKDYYVICYDRFERMPDGSLVAPANCGNNVLCIFISHDDGESFELLPSRIGSPYAASWSQGLVEPLLYRHSNGNVTIYARTGHCYQFRSVSVDHMKNFSPAEPSEFTSASSPMEMAKGPDGTVYAVYNPIPGFNGKYRAIGCHGRTPLVVRKSHDDGLTWGGLNIIEGDPECGYCYAAMFFTNDESLLMAYARGGHGEDSCLAHMGLTKFKLSEIIF